MPRRLSHHIRQNVVPSRGRVASTVALSCALIMLAVPALAEAGTLSYNAGTRVLTYTGSDATNLVFVAIPTGTPRGCGWWTSAPERR